MDLVPVRYAVVGWARNTSEDNGDHFINGLSVMISARPHSCYSKCPQNCEIHTIPETNFDGRDGAGVTAVGYRIIICGGFFKGGVRTGKKSYLEL